MPNEAVSVRVPLAVYLELAYQLRNNGDMRQPDEVVAFAVKAWLGKPVARYLDAPRMQRMLDAHQAVDTRNASMG
jgi:hypothetical protein